MTPVLLEEVKSCCFALFLSGRDECLCCDWVSGRSIGCKNAARSGRLPYLSGVRELCMCVCILVGMCLQMCKHVNGDTCSWEQFESKITSGCKLLRTQRL